MPLNQDLRFVLAVCDGIPDCQHAYGYAANASMIKPNILAKHLQGKHMQRLDDYFSRQHGARYSRAVPALHRKLGIIELSKMDASYGVDQSTLRAFRYWGNPPSVLYRLWAEDEVEKIEPKRLATKISTRSGFEKWHSYLHQSIHAHWLVYEYEAPTPSHLFKLIDLFIKWLSSFDYEEPKLTKAFAQYAHAALDKYTLGMMNLCYSEALPIRNPSMGDVQSENTYLLCQELIDRFSTEYGGTSLLFDYFAFQNDEIE